MQKVKIFIFENQYVEFCTLSEALDETFEISPANTVDAFKSIMDNVRIALNPGYGSLGNSNPSYRDVCLVEIIDAVSLARPQAIVMDHVLLGYNKSDDGVNLATYLRDAGIDVPIIFFSRTDQTNEIVVKAKEEVKDSVWIHKDPSAKDLSETSQMEKLTKEILKRKARAPRELASECLKLIISHINDERYDGGNDWPKLRTELQRLSQDQDVPEPIFSALKLWHSCNKDRANLTELMDKLLIR